MPRTENKKKKKKQKRKKHQSKTDQHFGWKVADISEISDASVYHADIVKIYYLINFLDY